MLYIFILSVCRCSWIATRNCHCHRPIIYIFIYWLRWLQGALKRSRSPSPPPANYHQGYGYKPGTIQAYSQQSMYKRPLTLHYSVVFIAILCCHSVSYLESCNRWILCCCYMFVCLRNRTGPMIILIERVVCAHIGCSLSVTRMYKVYPSYWFDRHSECLKIVEIWNWKSERDFWLCTTQ